MAADVTTDERILLGRLRIRMRAQGPVDGPPVLLLNGLGAPLELWDPLLAQLPGVRALTFDAPGSGGSGAPMMPMSIQDHARLAVMLLDRGGHPQVDVIGFSFGGMVAQELAHLAPTRVRRLVLASTSVGWGSIPGTPAAMLAITTPARFYSSDVFTGVAPQYIGGRESADRAFLRQQAQVRLDHPPSARGYLYQVWAAASWSSLCWLGQLRQPTLVLSGGADPLVPPRNAELLGSLLPDAQVHIARGAGHLCLLDETAGLAPRIEEFLRG